MGLIDIFKPQFTSFYEAPSKNPSDTKKFQRYFWRNVRNQTWGCWVRNENATPVLCSPLSVRCCSLRHLASHCVKLRRITSNCVELSQVASNSVRPFLGGSAFHSHRTSSWVWDFQAPGSPRGQSLSDNVRLVLLPAPPPHDGLRLFSVSIRLTAASRGRFRRFEKLADRRNTFFVDCTNSSTTCIWLLMVQNVSKVAKGLSIIQRFSTQV